MYRFVDELTFVAHLCRVNRNEKKYYISDDVVLLRAYSVSTAAE